MSQDSQIIANEDIAIPVVQMYCSKYPQKSHQFIQALPEKIWRNTKTLTIFANQSEKQTSYTHIQSYLNPKQFQLTKNLHIMREIIDNLINGMAGVELDCKLSVKLYVDVLATLAISVSKQDHIMSYYGQAQQMILTLSHHKNREVMISVYEQIIVCLKNNKPIINYPGLIVAKHQVMEILFTSPEFTKGILQNSLQNQNSLLIMLQIVIFFIEKDKFKIFIPYVPIFFALCGHPVETISSAAGIIIHKMPKNHAVICIGCKLFSTNAQNRRKLLSDLMNSKVETQPDIIEKISSGQFQNKKKQLKMSDQSIENYLNIIFNPGLDLNIRQSGIGQFIECMDRVEGSNGYDFNEAQILLVQQIRKVNKKQRFDSFEQKILLLHLLLCRKIDGMCESFTVEFMIGLLCKISSQQCKASVLSAIYLKLFQSPFNNTPCTKNWVMMYFPHVQMLKMTIEHPIRQEQKEEEHSKVVSIHSTLKSKDKMDRLYSQFVESISANIPISSEVSQILEQQVIGAVTTTDIPKISKLSFLCHWHKTNKILSKSTIKIILQYIRTNSVAIDLADDLIRFLSSGVQDSQAIGNLGCLSFLLASFKNRVIGGDQIDRLLKNVEDNISKTRVLKFLIQQSNIKYTSVNEYNNLKLMQSIISSVRSNSNDQHTRIICLTMLNKLSISQYKISDHIATILSLLRNLLFQSKISTLQFSLSLNCYSELLCRSNTIKQKQGVIVDKITSTIVEQLCSLIASSMSDDSSNYVMFASSFQFINTVLQIYDQLYDILQKQPHNMLIIASALLPKKIPEILLQKCVLLMTQIYTFLYLYSLCKQQYVSTLINSTDIIALSLGYIVPLCSDYQKNRKIKMRIRVELLEAIGKLMYYLARKYDQFVFKLNKIVRNDGTNAQYKLHYTVMTPIPMLRSYYQTIQKRASNHQYVKMVSWLFSIWKQESKILQDQEFVQPLISCALQIKEINYLAPLLIKSNTAQKLATASSFIGDKFKSWVKLVQELIYQKTKTMAKKANQSKFTNTDGFQQITRKISEGLTFAITIYYPTNSTFNSETKTTSKQTLSQCVKFIDQVYHLLELQDNEQVRILCNKLVVNLFRNEVCSKILNNLVNEGHFEIVNRLIQKVQKSTNNISELNEQLSLLGSISCNESVRSLIVKNRIIELLTNMMISMDENKVAKINYGFVYATVCFFFCLSAFKETNVKIQNEKRLLEIWSKLLGMQQSDVVEQKILDLLINLAAFKHSKPSFMACKQLHKTCMGLLSDPQYEHKQKVLTLIYNILYKNAAGIKMYKRKQVSELFVQLAEVDDLRDISEAVLQVLNNNQ